MPDLAAFKKKTAKKKKIPRKPITLHGKVRNYSINKLENKVCF